MRFGHFTAEALQAFAEAKGLDTKNQDFSEGVFDFKICEKPDGKFYGIPDQAKCKAPNKEAAARPDTGFLNSQQGRAINYDTAKSQGDAKTQQRTEKEEFERLERARKANEEKSQAEAAVKVKAEAAAKVKAAAAEAAAKVKAAADAKVKAEADRKDKAGRAQAATQAISDIPKLTKYYNEEYGKWAPAPGLRNQLGDQYYNALRQATDAIAMDIKNNAAGLSPYGKYLNNQQLWGLANDIMRRSGVEAPGSVNFMKAGPGRRLSLVDGDED